MDVANEHKWIVFFTLIGDGCYPAPRGTVGKGGKTGHV